MSHDKKIILISGKLPIQYRSSLKEPQILDDETPVKVHSKISEKYPVIMMGTIPNPSLQQLTIHDNEEQPSINKLLLEYQNNNSFTNTRIVPINLSTISTVNEQNWISYSDICLWPLFHYKLWDGLAISEDNLSLMDQLNNYKEVNEVFAESISPLLVEEKDEVWILDHYLLLLPEMLRDRFPSLSITTYHRGPWPSSEFFKCLPGSSTILEGMLGSSQIGMQTMNYIRHFISSSQRLIGCESFEDGGVENPTTGLPTLLIKQPLLGRDSYYLITEEERTAAIQEKYQLPSSMMILVIEDGSDILKLKAIREVLKVMETTRIHFIYSLMDQSQDGRTASLVLDEISKINSQFGSLEYTPIQLLIEAHIKDPLEWNSLICSCHMLLVTGDIGVHERVFDVCSLATKNNSMCSAFIVSEFVEVEYPFPSLIHKVNPFNEGEIKDTLLNQIAYIRCLSLPSLPPLLKAPLQHQQQSFSELFEAIQKSKDIMKEMVERPQLSLDKVLLSYEAAKGQRLFLLDYDGTLSTLFKRPEDAKPSQELLRAIRMLTMDPRNNVYVISGRDQLTLDNWFGTIKRLGLSAEHGSFLKGIVEVGDATGWITLLDDSSFEWKSSIEEVMEYYVERCPASFVEHKKTSLVWHYRAADPDFGSWISKEMVNMFEKMAIPGVEVVQGKKNVEVKSTSCNKGLLVRRIIERHGGGGGGSEDVSSFLFCAGDDRTDEDMFRMIEEIHKGKEDVFTCKVGGKLTKHSSSKYSLANPVQMVSLLMRLTSLVVERSMMTM